MRGKVGSWAVGTLRHTTWTDAELVYAPPCTTSGKSRGGHPLTWPVIGPTNGCTAIRPAGYDFWDFSTNVVTPVSVGIPTIGFGPCAYKLAHMRDENCEVDKIREACRFYVELIREL